MRAGSVSARLDGSKLQVKPDGHVAVSPVEPVQRPRLDSVTVKLACPPWGIVTVVGFALSAKPEVTTTSR